MNKTITKILSTNIKGQVAGADIGGGICIAGAPGIGKTQSMYAIAKELNMNIIQISLPELATEELSGLPEFVEAKHMDPYSTTGMIGSQSTTWTVPQIIENSNRLAAEAGKDGCILFLDDLHRISMAVAPYLYGLLGERKLGSYKLDKRVAIMAAMNDSEEAGFSGIDSPIKDRIGILPIKFDFDYWFNNFGKGLHFYVASFLKTHSSYVQEDESTLIEQFGSPRSWSHLANEFELYDLEFIKDNVTFLAKQKVSNAASNELAKHIAYVEAIDFTQKIKAKASINIKSLKPIDQILYAYIINYIDTIEDAAYVMSLMDNNIDSSNFIGFIAGELYTKYLNKAAGKPTSAGLVALLEKVMEAPLNPADYSKALTKKEQEVYDAMAFKYPAKITATMADFIH